MAVAGLMCRSRFVFRIEVFKGLRYSTILTSVQLNNFSQLKKLRHFRRLSTNYSISDKSKTDVARLESTSCSSDSDSEDEDIKVECFRGLPQITVPLPSRKERCRFTLRPVSNTVGDFLHMLRHEDKGIDRVIIQSLDRVRIASSTSIETLLECDFQLLINDKSYLVRSPKCERVTTEEIQRLSDIQNLVGQLYEALHVKDHHVQQERYIHTELETLQQEIQPLEDTRLQLDLVAQRKSNWLSWFGLGLMSVQFGILARLTWWEYSWDIMEPVTYFVTYGTAMACYAYFVLTKQEYVLTDVKDRQHLLTMHKKAKKLGFDVMKYNTLKDRIVQLETDLNKLKDPRKVPIPLKNTSNTPETSVKVDSAKPEKKAS